MDLAVWCQDTNLSLNVSKAKEIPVDYRKRRGEHTPIHNGGAVVEQVESFKFLGDNITNKLVWSKHTKKVMKSPLRRLKRFGMGPQILKNVYSCTIESILTSCFTVLYGNCSVSDRKGATEGSAYSLVHHWGQASNHPGPPYQAVSEEGPKNSPATPVIDSSLCYRMASRTGAIRLGPRGF